MNTNALKKFAQETRKKLMQQIKARLDFVLHTDSPILREKATQIQKLREAIAQTSEEQIIEKVTYTWFNRLMALRFMDVNEYQPLNIRIITPKDAYTLPELLDEAKQGHIPEELLEGSRPLVNSQKIYDLLDGKIPSNDPQNEAYQLLLIGACNHLHKSFPFLFERIEDYTELLLPEDLTSALSVVHDIRTGMSHEDCQEVEIIGWLYQFYISEKKDELINAKKKYKADEIAPVTQLFTPKWLVEYMVDNTLGQYWSEIKQSSQITSKLQFYIKPVNEELIQKRKSVSPEEIKFFDPCVGSAHVLCYAFDVFYKIYEEEGYDPSMIPELILTKNLYGLDIDDRATQLASFALMMKARKYYRRFFRKNIEPNIIAYRNSKYHPKFENAKVLGSLIKITSEEIDQINVDENTLFEQTDAHIKKQATFLANKYDIVVTNPPYLNSSYMEDSLKSYVEKEYNDTKADLFACFIIQASNFTKKDGLIGFICPYVWMFIQSYEKLRSFIISNTTISTLVQLEYNAFGPAVVPIASFVLRNQYIKDYKGSYIRLSEFKGEENQAPKTLEAIQNPDCGWFYRADQQDFEKIPGSPIGYWASEKVRSIFELSKISTFGDAVGGLQTGDNIRFLRFSHEICIDRLNSKWFLYHKGGGIRKWYGNQEHVVLWENNGQKIKTHKSAVVRNSNYYFRPFGGWSSLTSGKLTCRFFSDGVIMDQKGPGIYSKTDNSNEVKYFIAFFNSKVFYNIISIISPTLDYTAGSISRIVPYKEIDSSNILIKVNSSIDISKMNWEANEVNLGFQQNELIRLQGQDLEESVDLFKAYWGNKFYELHRNEEELNRQFIDIYGLQDELTPDVPLEEITILKDESSIQNGQLVFNTSEIMAQFVSYAVGCMFGRYSLDKQGLILANQGESLETYLSEVGKSLNELRFVPDEDNIIPILDDEWFEDDIVGRFKAFLKASFGTQNFDRNLAYVEECLGKDIRKYFTKDFYNDHIKRYKKRPIYWLFSSPKGSFNVLIYMHRYTPDTLNSILNDYLVEYREKLKNHVEYLEHIEISGSGAEQTKAAKEKDKIKLVLLELQEYEREILYPLAIERIAINLDDGVLVNYNRMGKAIKEVSGLNDKATQKKVKAFDWVKW
ncbi:BREX-1 system adenine-specific DNA-methyltransferase PglX [Arcicella rigui]|uniref:site-specific DNA-methyltransferase (adenine-specific) n=1 Tax=Arcicella rigui TaxID=797020 RepID=A0ABU5QE71_9BACT|nr:BREX-1 system adenine-specific DNA-methyltransferase PglX [Arcicella rigui]MEA5141150.1 BREX-1 system adenine-specific DNA-methyltransferase PglX [Arcicella rigui]